AGGCQCVLIRGSGRNYGNQLATANREDYRLGGGFGLGQASHRLAGEGFLDANTLHGNASSSGTIGNWNVCWTMMRCPAKSVKNPRVPGPRSRGATRGLGTWGLRLATRLPPPDFDLAGGGFEPQPIAR